MLVDTHCHLDFKDFDHDRSGVIDRAIEAEVGCIINIGVNEESTLKSVALSKNYDTVFSTMGVHPHDARDVTEEVIDLFRRLADKERIVAIGEVGLDFYRRLSPEEVQIKAFESFIALAKELSFPIVVHSRNAWSQTIEVLKAASANGHLKGVMHCFSGSSEVLRECLNMGFYISFTCNLTFKNARRLRELAGEVPVERLLLETDAPFMAPEQFRGKRNEPSHLIYLVDELAGIKGLSPADIARITTHNANKFFKLNLSELPKIVYPIRDSLYLNITNRCTNGCNFCVKNFSDFVMGHNLRLEREPSAEEVLSLVGDLTGYKEVIFCGYGEPTLRLDIIKAVSKELKTKSGARIRLVTNGHGNLIHHRSIAKELKELVDKVSVSLNVDSDERYNFLCKPKFGPGTYQAVLEFIKECIASGIETEITCLDLEGVDLKKCERLALDFGANFRKRSVGVVG